MVSLVVRALLVQGFLALHVQAVLSASDLADAELVLKEMLQKEQGEICGSKEISKLLSSAAKSNNRLAMWGRIEAISKAELQELDTLMQETLGRLADAKGRLAAKEDEEMEEMGAADILSTMKDALVEGGFDEDPEQAVKTTQTSKCGVLSAFRCKKVDPTCQPKRKAHQTSLDAFERRMTAYLTEKKVRAQGGRIYEECTKLFPAGDRSEGVSYCRQLCEKFSMLGAAASNSLYGQTAGKSSGEIQAEVRKLEELGRKYSIRSKKCEEATEALRGFKSTLATLEVVIDSTFNEWMNANAAMNEAETELEALKDLLDRQEDTVDLLVKNVLRSQDKVQQAVQKVAQLKMHQMMIKASWKVTRDKLKEAGGLVDDGDSALRAAEMIKEKVAGTIENLVTLYDFFVHEPLRNMMLDKGSILRVFDVSEAEGKSAAKFKESMAALSAHCEHEARPAFEKIQIPDHDFTKLCEFGGVEMATRGVEEAIQQRKDDVKAELEGCMKYYRDFSIPESAGTRTGELVEPVLIKEVIEAYPDAKFTSEYMAKWTNEGAFLGAIKQLRDMLDALQKESAALKDKIEDLTHKVEYNAKLREAAMVEVQKAIDEGNLAESEKLEAEKLLEAQREQAAQSRANLNKMKDLSEAAYQAYQGALGKFTEVFERGSLSLVQGKEAYSPLSLKAAKERLHLRA